MIKKYILALLAMLIFFVLVSSCRMPQGGITPVLPEIPRKRLFTSPANNPSYVRVVAHIDAATQNPLNVLAYYFDPSFGFTEPEPFFDHVVLGFAYLARDQRGLPYVRFSEALEYILENNVIYLRPLARAGIRIMLEVRSGRFEDHEDGIGLGLGTLDINYINLLFPNLRNIVDQFGIDGFEFNDIGGGRLARSPYTRNLLDSHGRRMYPDSKFQFPDGTFFSDSLIEEMLWHEGANNFTNLLLYINELFRELHDIYADFGSAISDNMTITIRSLISVRQTSGHGRFLPHRVREENSLDAYSGADNFIGGNGGLMSVIRDIPHDMTQPILLLNNEEQRNPQIGDFGVPVELYPGLYAPFIIDLSNSGRLSATDARSLGNFFAGTTVNPTRYGTLYFINLPPHSEIESYMFLRNFAQPIFQRTVRRHDGAGDHQVTWGK